MSLLELMGALTVTPMIVGAIATSLIAVMNLEGRPTSSINASSGAEIAASYFTPDVESAVAVTTSPIVMSSSTYVCGVAGTPVLSLSANAARATTTTYVEVAGARASSLYREVCTSSGTLVSNHLVSSNAPAGLTANLSPSEVASEASVGWVDVTTTPVSGIEMNLSVGSGQYALSATPETSTYADQAQNAFTPAFPLEVLDTSCPALTTSGGGSVSVGGGTGYLGVAATCPGAVSLGGNSTLSANVGTANAQYQTSPSVSTSSNATFGGSETYVKNGGSNPFANLTAPSTPSSVGVPQGTCTSNTCTSGRYDTALSLSNDGGEDATSFAPASGPSPGLIIFTQPVSITGSKTVVNFGGGPNTTYLFEQGLSVSGGSVNFADATYIYEANGSGSAVSISSTIGTSGGVLMYAESGSVSIAGQSSTSLTGSPTYDDIALWDGSNATVTLSGGSQTLTIGGVYAPDATVDLTGNGSLALQFLIAKDVTKSGTGAIALS